MTAARAVIFDFYGTLARATRWGPTIEEVLAASGLGLAPGALDEWWDESARGIEHPGPSASREAYAAWEHSRLQRLAVACGAADEPGAAPEATQVAAALFAALKDRDLEAYPEVPEVLAELSAGGTPVAVCSNWDWDLDHALTESGLDGAFDVAVTSAQVGARKPHERIYRAALEPLGVGPAECLFVGDNWLPDVEGPRSMGMAAAHLVRNEGLGGPLGPRPVGPTARGPRPEHPGPEHPGPEHPGPDDPRTTTGSANGSEGSVTSITDLWGVLDLL